MIKLKSLEVPWEIDNSFSAFKIIAEQEDKLIIQFNAFLGEFKRNILNVISENEIKKNEDTGIYIGENYQDFQNQIVQVVFDKFLSFRMVHTTKDYEILYNGEYEVFQPVLQHYSKDPLGYNKCKEEICIQTGFNPDSHFFIVDTMDKKDQLVERLNLDVFYSIGKEAYIEVIGADWKWNSIGALIM